MTQRPHKSSRATSRPGLLEALVALSILLSVSGVLMPAVGEEIGRSRQDQALADMQGIASGLAEYARDTLTLPTGVQGRTNIAWLYGPGEIPQSHDFGHGGEARPLADALLTSSMGGPGWGGPYVPALSPDPWGNAYLVNVEGWINVREHALLVCAGPDGIVETPSTAAEPVGDDLLLVLD